MVLVLAIVLLTFGALVAFGNWSVLVRWLVRRKRGSYVPLLGGLALLAGGLLLGGRWAALVVLADPA